MGKYNEKEVHSDGLHSKIGKPANQVLLKEYVTSTMINTTFHVINVFERISF